MKFILILLCVLAIMVLLSGCSIISYKGFPDGHTEVTAWVLGTDTGLSNFAGSTATPAGISRTVSFGGLESNQSKGLEALNQLLGTVAEGAAKGAKP